MADARRIPSDDNRFIPSQNASGFCILLAPGTTHDEPPFPAADQGGAATAGDAARSDAATASGAAGLATR
ncbi:MULTISPECIES: hypothetical protein [Catenuloplanes]|uniref:Uncharacterized protein n=1 Tax=Catenuloplanes niger TaxID=587534 RepID=A0AAE4CST6_9ACTN|nr:hypothetical protein [Catenuloplanes niger]MDR7321643.1 hypothetical protein [Catenuloplanes niger]